MRSRLIAPSDSGCQTRKRKVQTSACEPALGLLIGFTQSRGYARLNGITMTTALSLDLKKLQARAFDRADWAEAALQRYHSVIEKVDTAVAQRLRGLYHWMFVPPTLWPFNVQDVLEDCLAALEKRNSRKGR